VFRFFNTLTGPGATSITATARTSSGTQNVTASGSIGTDTHEYIVNLTGVPNASHVNVTLNGVTDSVPSSGNVGPVRMDVLLGDVNATARVDSNDVFQVRQQTLQPITDSNFRDDIDLSGRIDSNDVFAARQQSLTGLP
jgi:hypothetical protein